MGFISKKRIRTCKTDEEFAAEILEIFEEKLEELNITLPDKDRQGNKDEARIFGSNYYDLESNIAEFISMNKRIFLNKGREKNGRKYARVSE